MKMKIEFIVESKKIVFPLDLISNNLVESGGIAWENTYNLVLDHNFFIFWSYILPLSFLDQVPNPREVTKAIIYQKNRGIESNLPWINTLEVSDNNITESVEFYPYSCEIEEIE